MHRSKTLRLGAITGLLCLWQSAQAYAADIDGAWITDRDACDKVFVSSGTGVAFTQTADLYGSGFIISGNNIRGKTALCKITSMKRAGNTVTISASCATDIMVSQSTFTLSVQNENRLTRAFAGMPEMTQDYYRCNFGK